MFWWWFQNFFFVLSYPQNLFSKDQFVPCKTNFLLIRQIGDQSMSTNALYHCFYQQTLTMHCTCTVYSTTTLYMYSAVYYSTLLQHSNNLHSHCDLQTQPDGLLSENQFCQTKMQKICICFPPLAATAVSATACGP